MLETEIHGAEELAQRWQSLINDFPQEARGAMQEAILYVHSTVPPYPPPPAASTYRRTEALGRSISTDVRPVGGDVVGVIGTDVGYAPFVIDSRRQAWMHTGRWWTLQDVVQKATGQVVQLVGKRLARFFGGSSG